MEFTANTTIILNGNTRAKIAIHLINQAFHSYSKWDKYKTYSNTSSSSPYTLHWFKRFCDRLERAARVMNGWEFIFKKSYITRIFNSDNHKLLADTSDLSLNAIRDMLASYEGLSRCAKISRDNARNTTATIQAFIEYVLIHKTSDGYLLTIPSDEELEKQDTLF